jgi:23S rRNA (cytidine1920-2'-O)/16S rRNA (cytidine1409-2'-O)-methyltransferase
VTVGGAPTSKPSRLVAPEEPIQVQGPPPRFVSRGGEKLDAALDEFGIDVTDVLALDAGASTGGFTDSLLQRGAGRVIAVDVGHGQLHERLVADERVDQRDRTNIRSLDAAALGQPVDLVVADLSFISLRLVAPALLACARSGADLVLLVKPQFEATREEASKGKGVIRDEEVRQRVLDEVITVLSGLGAAIMGTMVSPLTGADGNVEYLVHARKQ